MTNKDTDDNEKRLRQRAEEYLANQYKDISKLTLQETQKILHELNIHQTELEMQNEELKLIQLDLKTSRENFVNLFENSPVGYLVLDEFGQILQSNQTLNKLIGCDDQDIRGQYLANYIHFEDLTIYTARFTAFYNRPENKILELRFKRNQTSAIDTEIRGKQINYQFGGYQSSKFKPSLLLSICEISARKRTEQELRLASNVFENSAEGIMIVDANNKFLKINHSFTAITGYQTEEVLGKTPKIMNTPPAKAVGFGLRLKAGHFA